MAFESFKRFEIKEAIYFETATDRSTRATYAETMDRRARAKETRVHYCETVLARRVESVSPRANFSKPNRTRESQRTFLPSLFKGGKKFFFSPSFSWIHLNEPRMQLKRYTWTAGKILIFLLIFR